MTISSIFALKIFQAVVLATWSWDDRIQTFGAGGHCCALPVPRPALKESAGRDAKPTVLQCLRLLSSMCSLRFQAVLLPTSLKRRSRRDDSNASRPFMPNLDEDQDTGRRITLFRTKVSRRYLFQYQIRTPMLAWAGEVFCIIK